MPNWLIAIAFAVALIGGLGANRWWARAHEGADGEGFGIGDLVGPITTLAVVLLAFIVVEAIGSYARARDNINTRRAASTR